jgi:hypothetical protein
VDSCGSEQGPMAAFSTKVVILESKYLDKEKMQKFCGAE